MQQPRSPHGRSYALRHRPVVPPATTPRLRHAAARVLERMRFSMTVCNKPVRLTHAVEPRWRDHLFGPFGFRFQLNIKVGARSWDPRGAG
jgi:hypothetical protein